MGYGAYNEIIIVSKSDDEQTIMALLGAIFISNSMTSFTLLNIYKELPISACATIGEIRDREVEFITTSTQLAAIHESGEVLVESTYMNAAIIAKPKCFDVNRNSVTVNQFSFAEVHVNKRGAVRVRLKIPMNINLVADSNKISGVIRDISITGVCVSTFAGAVLGDVSELFLHIKLLHGTTHELIETNIPARISRIEQKGVQYECVMTFQHTAESEQVLSMFIYQRQLDIIQELKAKII